MNAKIGNPEQICSAQRVQVTDGRGNGARQIYVANGKLNFVLSESNCLDMFRLWHEGTNVGFVSKNGLYTAPADFLHSFPCGMLYTCGLDAIGGVEGHSLHGRVHSIPAEIKELSADEKGVRIVAEIRDTALFGENLVLSLSGDARFADAAERVAFNAGPVCTSRDGTRHVYFQAPNRVLTSDCGLFKEGPKKGGGEYRREHFPRYCMASLNRILPIQIQHLWMKRENGLAAVMYGPNVLETSLDGAGRVVVESETDYPFGEAIRMKVSVEKAAAFPMWARLPKWCRSPEVRVNGASIETKAAEKGFVRIDRVWRTGDEVALVFPQEVSVSQGVDAEAGDAPYAAVTLGPLAMALPLEGTDENTQMPGAEWQFAYDPEVFSARVVRSPVRKDFAWEAGDSPVEVFVELRDATWNHDRENPSMPTSVAVGAARTVRFVPYGSARMRISMFPRVPKKSHH